MGVDPFVKNQLPVPQEVEKGFKVLGAAVNEVGSGGVGSTGPAWGGGGGGGGARTGMHGHAQERRCHKYTYKYGKWGCSAIGWHTHGQS